MASEKDDPNCFLFEWKKVKFGRMDHPEIVHNSKGIGPMKMEKGKTKSGEFDAFSE